MSDRYCVRSIATNFTFQWRGDSGFRHNMTRLIQSRQTSNGNGKTYFFRFAVDSPTMNEFRLKRNRPNVRGVIHADELSYFMKHNFGPMPDRQSMEFTAVRRFVGQIKGTKLSDVHSQNIFCHPNRCRC